MSDLEMFRYEERPVRAVTVDGEPWFVAVDVCGALGYTHTASALRMLRDAEKGVRRMHTPGGEQDITVINEPGLYRLVMRSNRAEAERFQDWVTGEVLPAIRRTGSYSTAPTVPDISTPAGVLAMADMLQQTAQKLVTATARVAELEPRAAAADALSEASGTLPIGAVANMFGIGRTTLFRILYAEGVLMRDKRPYQQWADSFRVVASTHTTSTGKEIVDYTAYLYPAGAVRLHALLTRRGHVLRKPPPPGPRALESGSEAS